jgi:hypothetical protein
MIHLKLQKCWYQIWKFVFSWGARDCTYSLMHARWVCYHWATPQLTLVDLVTYIHYNLQSNKFIQRHSKNLQQAKWNTKIFSGKP